MVCRPLSLRVALCWYIFTCVFTCKLGGKPVPRKSKTRITDKTVKIKPRGKPFEIRDRDLAGFILRIEPTGRKTFYYEYERGKRVRIGDAELLTVTEARIEAMQGIAAAKRGEIAKPKIRNQTPTLEKFADGDYRKHAETTQKAGSGNVQRLLSAFRPLGKKRLDQITTWDIEVWKSARKKSGAALATINRDLTMLRAALNKAVDWGTIEQNPIKGVKFFKNADNKRERYLSPEEAGRLENALNEREQDMRAKRARANRRRKARGLELLPEIPSNHFADHLAPMVRLANNTGMRKKELTQLRWRDVTLSGENPRVTALGSNTKTSELRHIPLSPVALDVLRKWREQTPDTDEFVFQGPDGKPIESCKTSWGNLMKRAKITNFHFHDLRHDFASQLVMAGEPLNTVRDLLGHATMEMTLRYAHLAPDHRAAAVSKLRGCLNKPAALSVEEGQAL